MKPKIQYKTKEGRTIEIVEWTLEAFAPRLDILRGKTREGKPYHVALDSPNVKRMELKSDL